MAGAREETMDAEQGAPYVDLQELSRYIADRTGIPAEVVARVLQAESEYLIERGIAQAEQDGAEHEIPGLHQRPQRVRPEVINQVVTGRDHARPTPKERNDV
jgi:hypothetical protein